MSYLIPRSFFSMPSLLDDDADWGFFSNTPSGLSLAEDEKNVYVEAAVPGVQADDIDVTFEKGVLRVVGESKKEEKEGKKYFRRSQSSFSYQVSLSSDVDMGAEPKSELRNGVLHLTFPKTAKAQPRKISVKAM